MSDENLEVQVEENSESAPEPEKKHAPEPGHPRFEQIYYENKQYERENDDLKKKIEDMQSKMSTVISNQETQIKATREQEFNAKLAGIEVQMDQAFESGDRDSHNHLKNELARVLSEYKGGADQSGEVDQEQAVVQSVTDPQEKDNPVEDGFKALNPWYGQNEQMTQKADEIIQSYKAKGATDAQAYNEASRQTQEYYNLTMNINNMTSEPLVSSSDVPSDTKNSVEDIANSLNDQEKAIAMQTIGNMVQFEGKPPIEVYKQYAKGKMRLASQ